MFARLMTRTQSKPETVKSAAQLRRGAGDRKAQDVVGVGWGLAGEIQPKLSVRPAADALEAEADRIAEQVVHRPGNDGIRDAGWLSAGPGHAGSGGTSSELLGGAGRSLESSLRAFFEPRFGFDFSRVRIFSDEQAAKGAQSIGALAYTAGPNIAFSGGRYQPGTAEGLRLLAHELTHVAQQGYAAMDGRGAKVVTRRAPAIQRDTPAGGTQQNIPPGATSQGGPLSVTARYDPANASREEVVQALTDYLNEELALQRARGLDVLKERVRLPVLKLFQDNRDGRSWFESRLSEKTSLGTPEDLAAEVGEHLPDFIPRKHMMHLYRSPVKAAGPTSAAGKVKAAIKEKVGELGKRPEDVRDPKGSVEPPSTEPTMGGSPGQRIIKTPSFPFGGTPPPRPKPNLPQAPLARQQQAVKKIVQALDDEALIPAAARGTPQAEDFDHAKPLAEDVADALAYAEARKQSTVDVTISKSYRHVEDLGQIFDKIENIVRQIAAVLPGGVKDVDEVIISPKREGKSDKIPARRVVKLHGGT
jgi:hypothetical protein